MEKPLKIIIGHHLEPLYDILRYNLEKRMYEVSHASTGEELIEKAILINPDLIITKIYLKDMDAFALFEKLWEKAPGKRHTPSIIISPIVDRELIKQAADMGITGYIAEPFDLEDLVERIENVLGKNKVIEVVKMHGKIILEFKGGVTYFHSKIVKNAFNVLLGAKHFEVIVDFTETNFLAHQVLVVFITAYEKFRQHGGNLVICGANEGLKKLLNKSMVDRIIEIFPDRATALRSIHKSSETE